MFVGFSSSACRIVSSSLKPPFGEGSAERLDPKSCARLLDALLFNGLVRAHLAGTRAAQSPDRHGATEQTGRPVRV
jgi:hypothetical protein